MDPSEVPSPLIDRPAPAFEAPDLHDPDRVVSLDDITGRVALVNVWASWCAACLEEHPYITALAERGVPVYGINYKDTRAAALAWLERHGDAYVRSAFDPKGRIGLDWGVYGVPETYVLDARGVIRHKHIGVIDAESLQEEIWPVIERLQDASG